MSLKAFPIAGLLVISAAIPAGAQSLRVVDPQGKPVAGAQVILRVSRDVKDPLSAMFPDLAEGETDASGSPSFRIPLRDRLRILIDSQDFLPVARDLAPRPGELRIPLEPGRTWRGKVTLEKEITGKGKICAAWSETIPNWERPLDWQRCSDLSPQGEFELKGLGAPEVDTEVQVPGYLTLKRKVALASPGLLRLRRGILLQGRVVRPGAGAPIAQASLRSAGSAPVESEKTGAFAIGVPSLPATLDVSAPGFRARKVPVKSRPKKDFVIQLERGEQIRGSLADEQGRAIPKAVFWIERSEEGHRRSEEQTVRTDRGAFVLDLPAPGLYRLRIRAEGFREEAPPEVAVAAGESRSLGTVVVRRGLGVEGQAVDAKTGEPLADVDLELRPEGPQLLEAVLHRQSQRTVSDSEGYFILSGLGVGRFTLTARRSGYAPAILTTSLSGTQMEDLGTVRLEHGILLRGKVTDREGSPRSGLTVRLFGPEPGSLVAIAERTTGPGGTFEGPAVASGRYRVQVWGGRLLLAQEIEVPGGREEQSLDLKAGGVHLTGTVTRAGEPVAGGSLSLSSKLDPADSRGKIRLSSEGAGTFTYGFPETQLATDVRDDGTFEIADAPSGTLRIDYTGRDGAAVTREAQVPDEARASLTLDITGVPLHGRLLDHAQGTGIQGTVRVTDTEGSLVAIGSSEADGAFQIADLQPGRYTLEASAEDFVPRVLPGVEAGPAAPPIDIALDRGETGSLHVHLERPDGSPGSWIPLALLDVTGRTIQALPTDTAGELRFQNLPPGTYVLVWSDPFAGTGASEPLQIETGREATFQRTLPEGASVELHCDLDLCAGRAVDRLALSTSTGVEIGPYLSGVSPALRFSAAGELTLGRLTPGSYVLRVWSGGRDWSKSVAVGAGEARVSLP
jgi:hypothetical protein